MQFTHGTYALRHADGSLHLPTNPAKGEHREMARHSFLAGIRARGSIMAGNTDLKEQLAAAFVTAAEAHAFAFTQVDGKDDDWAYWYAKILQQPLSKILGRKLTRTQIVICLFAIEDERLARFGAGEPWPQLYGEHFRTMFASDEPDNRPKLALYYYPECPYCQRVLKAIADTGTEVELRHIWDEPQHRTDLQAARGRTTVPVLRITGSDGDRWMPESADIVRYLQERAG